MKQLEEYKNKFGELQYVENGKVNSHFTIFFFYSAMISV